jgi:hypothetical protein
LSSLGGSKSFTGATVMLMILPVRSKASWKVRCPQFSIVTYQDSERDRQTDRQTDRQREREREREEGDRRGRERRGRETEGEQVRGEKVREAESDLNQTIHI